MKVLEVQAGYGLDNLRIAERPDPKPGHGQIVVRMKALSLNYRDVMGVKGALQDKTPFVPLSDGAGVVDSVGPGVTRVKRGDKVATNFFGGTWIAGPPTAEKRRGVLGGPNDGAAQELMLIPADGPSFGTPIIVASTAMS